MGYWNTSATGESFASGTNPDGSEMLWGDSPADAIDSGIDRLIARLNIELGRPPTVAEIDAVKAAAPEMVAAIAEAIVVFCDDLGRQPTDGEIKAGLAFCDTATSLDSAMRRTISIGDTIRWAVMVDRGFYREIDYIHEGVVDGKTSREVGSIFGPHQKACYSVRDAHGVTWTVDKAHANKVLPDDEPIEQVNARRREIANS